MLQDTLRLGFGEEIYQKYIAQQIKDEILLQAVGELTFSYFSEISFNRKVLNIKVDSAPLRTNLILGKTNIITKINDMIGFKFVDNIVFF